MRGAPHTSVLHADLMCEARREKQMKVIQKKKDLEEKLRKIAKKKKKAKKKAKAK